MMLNPANGSNNIGGRNSNRSPFTATQWQELEHQALIFKYMVSGVPVPHELLYSVKRSLESSLASRLFPHQPIGLGCFQAGFGKKTDPEPGRCRRTDGKKWRCSKEAYPDSKYCERHMHRGRNRSRKPVELLITNPTSKTTSSEITRNHQKSSSSTATTSATTTAISPSSSSYSFSPLSNASLEPENIHNNPNNLLNPFLYPPSNSSNSRPPAFSPQNSTTHNLFLDSASSSSSHAHAHHHKDDYRYFHGGDERDFFPEAASGGNTIRCLQDSYNNHQLYKNYSQTDQFLADDSKQLQEQQHCFVLGTDFKSSSRPIKLQDKERDDGDQQTQKPLHHFFGDQWPPKETESWLDLASTSRLHNDS